MDTQLNEFALCQEGEQSETLAIKLHDHTPPRCRVRAKHFLPLIKAQASLS